MAAALGLPLAALFDFSLPAGAGDKRALRAALAALGLRRAAARPKRAIQFGSRLSKHANVRDFGSGRRANAAGAGSVPLAALAARRLAVSDPPLTGAGTAGAPSSRDV